ncbi:nascent polypeptide-associated complex subunit alpha, muscle-specific form-like [Tachyglossus aculeatus]|uniref:nascent polypeptide-associated complex subunit alpha, muscle-specific form-like n=1 Tax=Tachyglossus aculeatus TaxID=9261 RepID=UPI0018F28DF0|nr:nascent polypeptide-associated complex subunit alpha, muscle-specific form-like [Tachyglossus aculeatus]
MAGGERGRRPPTPLEHGGDPARAQTPTRKRRTPPRPGAYRSAVVRLAEFEGGWGTRAGKPSSDKERDLASSFSWECNAGAASVWLSRRGCRLLALSEAGVFRASGPPRIQAAPQGRPGRVGGGPFCWNEVLGEKFPSCKPQSRKSIQDGGKVSSERNRGTSLTGDRPGRRGRGAREGGPERKENKPESDPSVDVSRLTKRGRVEDRGGIQSLHNHSTSGKRSPTFRDHDGTRGSPSWEGLGGEAWTLKSELLRMCSVCSVQCVRGKVWRQVGVALAAGPPPLHRPLHHDPCWTDAASDAGPLHDAPCRTDAARHAADGRRQRHRRPLQAGRRQRHGLPRGDRAAGALHAAPCRTDAARDAAPCRTDAARDTNVRGGRPCRPLQALRRQRQRHPRGDRVAGALHAAPCRTDAASDIAVLGGGTMPPPAGRTPPATPPPLGGHGGRGDPNAAPCRPDAASDTAVLGGGGPCRPLQDRRRRRHGLPSGDRAAGALHVAPCRTDARPRRNRAVGVLHAAPCRPDAASDTAVLGGDHAAPCRTDAASDTASLGGTGRPGRSTPPPAGRTPPATPPSWRGPCRPLQDGRRQRHGLPRGGQGGRGPPRRPLQDGRRQRHGLPRGDRAAGALHAAPCRTDARPRRDRAAGALHAAPCRPDAASDTAVLGGDHAAPCRTDAASDTAALGGTGRPGRSTPPPAGRTPPETRTPDAASDTAALGGDRAAGALHAAPCRTDARIDTAAVGVGGARPPPTGRTPPATPPSGGGTMPPPAGRTPPATPPFRGRVGDHAAPCRSDARIDTAARGGTGQPGRSTSPSTGRTPLATRPFGGGDHAAPCRPDAASDTAAPGLEGDTPRAPPTKWTPLK